MAKPAGVSLISLLILASAAVHVGQAKNWGLIISSARGWYNYGMQSDALHAYRVMREGGVPQEQLVVMLYDDLAEDERNPFPGQVFASYDLVDVYKGAHIDYTGDAVTKKNFLSVLSGDKEAVRTSTGGNGKVIDSGPEDNIFVFIDDHGGPGFVVWWDDDDLTAKELNKAIRGMHENNRYKNMVIYIDTCYSGSMFENILPDNIGVYAATAANATEVAWNSDCLSQYFTGINQTCLGGVFTINWAYETQSDNRKVSTLDMQFREAVIASEGRSHPSRYGDLSIAQKNQTYFFGDSASNPDTPSRRSRRSASVRSTMPKHTMVYHHLKNRLSKLRANSEEYSQVSKRLNAVESLMRQADQLMKEIATRVYGRFQSARATRRFGEINWSCYEPVLKAVKAQCPGMTRREEVKYYAMAQFGVLVNLCSDAPTHKVLTAVRKATRASPLCSLD